MTPEELLERIDGPPEELVAALAPLQESERKKLSKTATERLERISAGQLSAITATETPRHVQFRQRMAAAQLAVVGLAGWGAAKKIPNLYGWNAHEGRLAAKILADRRPDWLPKWIDAQLEQGSWPAVRALVRMGACPKPTSDRYIVQMIRSHAGWIGDGSSTLRKTLEEDRELLEDEVWRIFEISAWPDTLQEGYEIEADSPWSWGSALMSLSADGVLDRNRLLDASIEALARGPLPRNAVWYYRFHERMQPTTDESAARQAALCDLLSSALTTIVGFALDRLTEVAKAGKLSWSEFVRGVGPVFEIKPKGQPLAALKLLELGVKQNPGRQLEAARAAAGGLGHSAAEVQKRALDLSASWAQGPDPELAERIAGRMELISSTLRDRASALEARVRSEGSQGPSAVPPDGKPMLRLATPDEEAERGDGADPAAEIDSLAAEAESLDPHWRSVAGVDAVLAAWRSGGYLAPVSFEAAEVPQLDPERALQPVRDVEQLLERLSAAIEGATSYDEFELLADGASRLIESLPDDFSVRVAPLKKRLTDAPESFGMSGDFQLTAHLHTLLCCWLHGAMIETAGLPRRVREVAYRLRSKKALRLLAAPTHAGGWIDPRVFVERLVALEAEGKSPARLDLLQALWRLAPDGRAQAREAARDLAGELGAAVRFALGEEPSDPAPVVDGLLWCSAWRGRSPRQFSPALADVRLPPVPDAGSPAQYSWSIEVGLTRTKDYRDVPFRLVVGVKPRVERRQIEWDHPLALVHEQFLEEKGSGYFVPPHRPGGLSANWPVNPDAALVLGAQAIAERLDMPASSLSTVHAFLEPLLSPDATWSEPAALALACGLLSRAPETHAMAADVLIGAIEDGRTTGEDLGAILARFAHAGQAKLNRLADVLAIVGRGSLLHAEVCRRIAGAVLAGLESPPRDLHYLLTALLEWQAQTGEPLDEASRKVLEGFPLAGKTAKLAKQALAGPAGPSQRPAIFALALAGRVERARRWERRTGLGRI